MKTFTKPIFAIGFGVLIMTSAASSAPQPGIEFLGHPEINGKPLPFSDAVRVGDVLYLSGQIGVGPDGKLPSGITAQTEQAMENIGAVLKRAGLGYEHLFHCTAFLADMNDWAAFNAVYVRYFPSGRMPARSAFGANGLALDARLEIECQAYAGRMD